MTHIKDLPAYFIDYFMIFQMLSVAIPHNSEEQKLKIRKKSARLNLKKLLLLKL